MSIIQPQVDCSSARELLEALSPIGQYFNYVPLNEPWLFRGQGWDAPLIPTLLRNNGRLQELTQRDLQASGELRLAERDIVLQFFDIADKRGLILPDDSQELRIEIETLRSERGDRNVSQGERTWKLYESCASLMALAQHYGLPTRLLDWTRNANIAAFFAAESAAKYAEECKRNSKEHNPNSLMVVWAFYFPLLGKHDAMDRGTFPIQVITAPSATNANLKAQQGVFTLTIPRYYRPYDYPDEAMPLNEFLESIEKQADIAASSNDRMLVELKLRKFTLPVSEARYLLYLLAKLDITPSSIYPGYRNIIDDLRWQHSFHEFENQGRL